MAYVGGTLYTSGGFLVLLTVLVPSWDLYAPGWVLAVALTAIPVGGFFLWAAERLPMPLWQYSIATSLGAVLVTVAVVGGGPETTATYGVLYVFVTAYGFYYYPWPLAVWFIIVSGVGYAAALVWHDVDAALVEWIVIIGTTVIAGGLIGSLGREVRRLLAVEQQTVEDLNELNRWKTTFLRAASHDLRSPLAAMLGLLRVIQDHHEDLTEEQRQELLARSINAGERLQGLVIDLLDLERIEAGDIEPRLEMTHLGEVIHDSLAALDLQDRVEVHLEPVMAPVERTKVERIVTNLISNAVRHTPRGTRIWVRVEEVGDHAVLTVEDDGPGIPDGVRIGLFEAFRGEPGAGANGHDSVGLGLHLVRRFTELHGGEVAAGDRPDGGTRILVRLPLTPRTRPT